MFKGKLAMWAVTTGTSADTYAPDGNAGDILTDLSRRDVILDGLILNLGLTLLYAIYSYGFHLLYDRLRSVLPVMVNQVASADIP